MSPFLDALLPRHETWRQLPIVERAGDGWRGIALCVPPPPGSDLIGPLDIEDVGGEITITLDYSHIHMGWPMRRGDVVDNVWHDAMAMIDAILCEKVLSVSGWIDGQLRQGMLQEAEKPLKFIVPKIRHVRVRSWRGTFDRETPLINCG